jgi:hypothetical protein
LEALCVCLVKQNPGLDPEYQAPIFFLPKNAKKQAPTKNNAPPYQREVSSSFICFTK